MTSTALQVEQSHRGEHDQHHRSDKAPALARALQDRHHHPPVQAVCPGILGLHDLLVAFAVTALEQPIGEPGRDHQRHHQAERHRQRGADRHGRHVGAHQAAHRNQRQDRDYHRERGQHCGIAHFVDRRDRRLKRRQGSERVVTVDVLHDDNRIIHHQAGDKYQCEQGHPVDRVAENVIAEQSQSERNRHGDKDDRRAAHAETQSNDDGHGDDRADKMHQQFIGLIAGRTPVVAGDCHLHIRRDNYAFQLLGLADHITGDFCRAAALAFGHSQSDRAVFVMIVSRAVDSLIRRGGPESEEDMVADLLRPVLHRCHIREVHRPVVVASPPPGGTSHRRR